MPTFIDESGDLGWKVTKRGGASTHFRVTAVWFENLAVAASCRNLIQGLWQTLQLSKSFTEFHYVDLGHKSPKKIAFFDAIASCDFRFVTVDFDKRPSFASPPPAREVYAKCALYLAGTLRQHYLYAESMLPMMANGKRRHLHEELVLDRNDDPHFLQQFEELFGSLGTLTCGTREPIRLVRKPCFRDSKKEHLLQLADMLCGATCDHIEGMSRFYDKVKSKCLGIIDLE